MRRYRITKYDPQYRNGLGIYVRNEWTSIADIGKQFEDGILTEAAYEEVESNYIQCCMDLIHAAAIGSLRIVQPEIYDNTASLPGAVSNDREMSEVIREILREKCWAKLEAHRFFIHFGYDYYMYVGTSVPKCDVAEIARKYHLFCELSGSPASANPSEWIKL